MEKKEVQCFRCQGIGHYKQEYLDIKVEKEKKRSEEIAYVVSLQKAQQKKRPAYSLQRKVQEYSSTQGMPPRRAALEQREWTTKWKVVTFVECRGCNHKGTKMQENQEQGFVSGEHLRNVWCNSCLEAQRWRENIAKERGVVNVKCSQCRRKDIVERISKKKQKENCVQNVRLGGNNHSGIGKQWYSLYREKHSRMACRQEFQKAQ